MTITHVSFDSLRKPRPDTVELSPGFLLSLVSAGDMGPSGIHSPHRLRYLEELAVARDRFRMVRQVHSQTVLNWVAVPGMPAASGSFASEVPEADGILFDRRSSWAGVTVADCMPILVEHPDSGVSALLHSGWKGTGIVTAAVQGICTHTSARPGQLRAVLGPAISVQAYAVPRERAIVFAETFGAHTTCERGGEWFIDLEAANLTLLERLGVSHARVVSSCTYNNPLLGSYRRDGSTAFLRMLAAAGPFQR